MAIQQTLPKWATLDRKNYLVELFLSSRGFCVYGHKNCLVERHHYSIYSELLISDWQANDRQELNALWLVERKRLHSTGERTRPARGQFSAISRDIYAEAQPLYYLDGQSISGLTFTPFVRVRIASSYIRLYVDLGDILRQVSKSKRRKAIRYGKPLPMSLKKQISQKVLLAVKNYHTH